MKASARLHRFSVILLLAFFALSVPILSFVLIFSYLENSRSMRQVLEFDIQRAQSSIARTVVDFFGEAVRAVEGLSSLAAYERELLRSSQGSGVLISSLVAIEHLDGISVSFEDGSSAGATRIDDLRRVTQPDIPPSAVWHTFDFAPSSARTERRRQQVFYDTWPHVLTTQRDIANYDPRGLPSYQSAKSSMRTTITKPSLNPATGEHIISVSTPIIRNGEFQGVVNANFNVSEISNFLAINNVTPHSISAIIDGEGKVIAPPVIEEISESPTRATELWNLIRDVKTRVSDAFKHLDTGDAALPLKTFTIDSELDALSLITVENRFGLDWRLLIITPKKDFIGPLQDTNDSILWLLAAVIPIQLILIIRFARRIAQGIEIMSGDIHEIRSMELATPLRPNFTPHVREIAELQEGIGLLRSALRSFAQYIPVGVVRHLIESSRPLELGVEKRRLTLLFSDLENFSGVAEKLTPDELLEQLSATFSCITNIVAEELGTVDKFIGDAVMAFWGAPTEIPNHALCGCKAALRIASDIRTLNQAWQEQGRPTLPIRIGLNTAEVLVGNIGTPDRLSYTALGDGVNVASRLEGINKEFGTTICISEDLYKEVAESVEARPLGLMSVKGRTAQTMVYELVGIKVSPTRKQKLREPAQIYTD
jgi:class 3 adenylate cyclase